VGGVYVGGLTIGMIGLGGVTVGGGTTLGGVRVGTLRQRGSMVGMLTVGGAMTGGFTSGVAQAGGAMVGGVLMMIGWLTGTPSQLQFWLAWQLCTVCTFVADARPTSAMRTIAIIVFFILVIINIRRKSSNLSFH